VSVLDHLWNGWRAAYVQRSSKGSAEGSVFRSILESGMSDDEAHIVERGERCFVILNAFPYSPGHMLVLPYREVGNVEDLDADEHTELWSLVTRAIRALKDEYRPHGVNVGLNLGAAAGGSVSSHLHVHVLPRWGGDSNFMVSVANTKILPEALDVSASRLRAAFGRLGRP
jgi:ATP adenylyltransferase